MLPHLAESWEMPSTSISRFLGLCKINKLLHDNQDNKWCSGNLTFRMNIAFFSDCIMLGKSGNVLHIRWRELAAHRSERYDV